MVPAENRSATQQEAAAGEAPTLPEPPLDAGLYEQGGRVAWPEAVDGRGHAVFVLRGDRLRGGFALQRTRGEGLGSGWLFVKRRDEYAAAR